MRYECTEERFLKDVSSHIMTIVRDDGTHRHVRFKKPDSSDMFFDIVTYPGYLVYSGDMGCYVFSRISDMFQFFRGKSDGPLRINESYWGEKLEAVDKPDGYRKYDPELFRKYVVDWLAEQEPDNDLSVRVDDELLSFANDNDEAHARDALMEFEHEGQRPFQDSWDCSFDQYTFRFTWCCYALAWAIRHYDAAKATETTV